jgi:hypothetical protein
MDALISHRGARLRWSVLLLCTAATLSACEGDEAEVDEVPEVAEVEVKPGGGVELEETFPLTPEDIGETIMATGVVVGNALPTGFFLRTEGSQVLFVEATQPVAEGDTVRVVGPLQTATAAVFEGWEVDAFEGEAEAEWKMLDLWYIDAATVSKVTVNPSPVSQLATRAPGNPGAVAPRHAVRLPTNGK